MIKSKECDAKCDYLRRFHENLRLLVFCCNVIQAAWIATTLQHLKLPWIMMIMTTKASQRREKDRGGRDGV